MTRRDVGKGFDLDFKFKATLTVCVCWWDVDETPRRGWLIDRGEEFESSRTGAFFLQRTFLSIVYRFLVFRLPRALLFARYISEFKHSSLERALTRGTPVLNRPLYGRNIHVHSITPLSKKPEGGSIHFFFNHPSSQPLLFPLLSPLLLLSSLESPLLPFSDPVSGQ